MLRLPRWTFRSVKVPVQNGPVTVQRARIQTSSRRTGTLIATSLLIAAWYYPPYFLIPKDVREDLQKFDYYITKEVERSKAQHKTPQPWIGVPLVARKMKPLRWSTSAPEWQEFLKLEQDQDRVSKLKTNVGKMAATSFIESTSSRHLKSLGLDEKVSYSCQGTLDFVFPLGPPVAYERLGFVTSRNGLEWQWRKLSDQEGRRFNRILYPTIVVSAFWAGGTAFFKFYTTRLRDRAYKLLEDMTDTSESLTEKPAGWTVQERANIVKAMGTPPGSSINASEDSPASIFNFKLPPPTPGTAMHAAARAYKRHFMKLQIEALNECPRGGCELNGYVDVIGTRATVRMPIRAIYLPAKDVFLWPSPVLDTLIMPNISALAADLVRMEDQRAAPEKRKATLEKGKAVMKKEEPEQGKSPEPEDKKVKVSDMEKEAAKETSEK